MTLKEFVSCCVGIYIPATIDECGPNDQRLRPIICVKKLDELYHYEALLNREIDVFSILRSDDETLFWAIVLKK